MAKVSLRTSLIAWLIGAFLLALPYGLAPGTFPNQANPVFLGIPVFLVWSSLCVIYIYAWIIYIVRNFPRKLPSDD